MSQSKLFYEKLAVKLTSYSQLQATFATLPKNSRSVFHDLIDQIVIDLNDLQELSDAPNKCQAQMDLF